MDTFKQKLLNYYNFDESKFLEFTKPIEQIELKNPNKIKGLVEAKELVFEAIQNKEKIIIYGDYDCDGISATSIMVKTFQKLEYPVSYYIPSRYIDGYGLNVENVIAIANNGFKLIITVDNGIAQHEAILEAKKRGIKVIVVDHHELPKTPVEADVILHPIYSEISNVVASGGYMSLFLSAGLLGHYDDYLVTIAGLSVISDLMSLEDYNRDVVRLALSNLTKNRYLPLKLLLDNEIITEKSFSLDIAPKINAVGRIVTDKSVNLLVKYLTSENKEDVYQLRDWIISTNEKRKELTKQVVDSLDTDFSSQSGIAINLDIKEGLIGLIANRLLNQYNVPSVVFTTDENDKTILKGSIRSKEGFNVVKAFESLKKYIINGGGHSLAGGLSIKKDEFEDFKKEFLKLTDEYKIKEEQKKTIEINISDINMENYEFMRKFAPFGMSNEEPLLEIKNLPTRGLDFISMGKHLSTSLSMNSKLLGFNMNSNEIKSHSSINLYGNFNLSVFRNYQTLEFRISKYKF